MFDHKDREARKRINELSIQMAKMRRDLNILFESHKEDPAIKSAIDENNMRCKIAYDDFKTSMIVHLLDED